MIYVLLCVLSVQMLVIYLALRVLGKIMRSRDNWKMLAINHNNLGKVINRAYITTLRSYVTHLDSIGVDVPDEILVVLERRYDSLDNNIN